MSYDQNIPAPQGAVKLSEIAVDRIQPVININPGDSSIVMAEQLRAVLTDALMKESYFLHSNGIIDWLVDLGGVGTLVFNDSHNVNDIVFTILQTPDNVIPTSFNLVLHGTDGTENSSNFKSLTLVDDDLLYIEIDRALLLAGGNTVAISNGVNYAGTIGQRLVKVNLSNGLPQLHSPVYDSLAPGAMPTTLFIPLCWRHGPSNDLLWIPHGILWPQNTDSTLGAIITRGLEIYPSAFVKNLIDFQMALAQFGSTGGIICVIQPFALDTNYSIPSGITLLGRSSFDGTTGVPGSLNPLNTSSIIVGPGKGLILLTGARVKDLNFLGTEHFGQYADESMIEINGGYGIIENCSFTFQNTSRTGPYGAIGVNINSSYNKVVNCKFNDVISPDYHNGVFYGSGDHNYDLECQYS